MNYYLKESSKIFLLKYLKYTKITIFIVISSKSGKKSTSRPKKSTKKHIKKQLVKKKHKKAHVLSKSTLCEHCWCTPPGLCPAGEMNDHSPLSGRGISCHSHPITSAGAQENALKTDHWPTQNWPNEQFRPDLTTDKLSFLLTTQWTITAQAAPPADPVRQVLLRSISPQHGTYTHTHTHTHTHTMAPLGQQEHGKIPKAPRS